MSANVYDEVRYSNYPYAQTHPARLATVAILHGVEPSDPFNARVLEVGCGAGGNLLAMAAATPGIRALGVDLAAAPIAEGQRAIDEIGLTNVELRQADVRSLTAGAFGEFDYIVAHGVYGWIPEDARDSLMAAIAALLSPAGLAYVSYNAHPGGYFRRLLRDAGLWHARGVSGEAERAAKAQELYRFLKEHRMTPADTYGAVLEREVPMLADGPLYRLVHDDLSEHWHPLWFNEFAEHAAHHGLGYVGEADMFSLRTEMLPEGVEAEVWKLADGDRIAFETYSDLLTARHFRQSVLCRAGAPVQAEPSPERAQRLHWAVRPNAEPLEVGLVADAFALLDAARPRALGFDALRAELGADAQALGEALIDGFRRERLMPHAGPLHVALEAGERPRASALARWQAARGEDITSLVYLTVRMEEPAARLLITLLDGTRDRAAIAAALRERAGLELTPEDLDRNLHELARLYLLEPE
ncbi:MAG TPA: class I SAM-dependent methyltransferase [Solirubrobacter sp.]|nr:class I SAM-dependent methyltransferase [Solirubrobacter sp.]